MARIHIVIAPFKSSCVVLLMLPFYNENSPINVTNKACRVSLIEKLNASFSRWLPLIEKTGALIGAPVLLRLYSSSYL